MKEHKNSTNLIRNVKFFETFDYWDIQRMRTKIWFNGCGHPVNSNFCFNLLEDRICATSIMNSSKKVQIIQLVENFAIQVSPM